MRVRTAADHREGARAGRAKPGKRGNKRQQGVRHEGLDFEPFDDYDADRWLDTQAEIASLTGAGARGESE